MTKSELPFGNEFSLPNILDEINSIDRVASGLALETLVFELMGLLDMKFVAMRLPAQATDGIETECVFESTKPVFSRWQVRCKNTTSMTIDDVAKAVGLTHVLKSNVIVMVNTGEIDTKARLFADRVMAGSNLSIVMIDRNDLNTMCNNPDHIVEILEREAHHARTMRCMEF